MCLGSNYTIVCCCFELLLFSVILCYALWHNQYSAEGVMEFICCNQTLGFFFIIIIIITHRVQAPRIALYFLNASKDHLWPASDISLPYLQKKGPAAAQIKVIPIIWAWPAWTTRLYRRPRTPTPLVIGSSQRHWSFQNKKSQTNLS